MLCHWRCTADPEDFSETPDSLFWKLRIKHNPRVSFWNVLCPYISVALPALGSTPQHRGIWLPSQSTWLRGLHRLLLLLFSSWESWTMSLVQFYKQTATSYFITVLKSPTTAIVRFSALSHALIQHRFWNSSTYNPTVFVLSSFRIHSARSSSLREQLPEMLMQSSTAHN